MDKSFPNYPNFSGSCRSTFLSFSPASGLSEEAIVSPIPFLVMINDLLDVLKNVEASLYAGDTALRSSMHQKIYRYIY